MCQCEVKVLVHVHSDLQPTVTEVAQAVCSAASARPLNTSVTRCHKIGKILQKMYSLRKKIDLKKNGEI